MEAEFRESAVAPGYLKACCLATALLGELLSFKVLKSEIEIGPVCHRLPERIRAHASICFMALILHRVMRSRLKAADAGYTPERALEHLQRIQHHRVRLNGGEPVAGVSTLSTEQNEVLHALGIEKPAAREQLALL